VVLHHGLERLLLQNWHHYTVDCDLGVWSPYVNLVFIQLKHFARHLSLLIRRGARLHFNQRTGLHLR